MIWHDRRDGVVKEKLSHSGKWEGFTGINGRVESLFIMANP